MFEDVDRDAAQKPRQTPVAKAKVSERARQNAGTKQSSDGDPVHSFTTLLDDLATLTLNEVQLPGRVDAACLCWRR